MIDMKLAGSTAENNGAAVMPDATEYPYGLRISLDNDTLAKLGMTELPAIDAEFKVVALACVVSVSQNESQGSEEPYRSVELQIEMVELKPAKEEEGEPSNSAQRLYSRSNMNS